MLINILQFLFFTKCEILQITLTISGLPLSQIGRECEGFFTSLYITHEALCMPLWQHVPLFRVALYSTTRSSMAEGIAK